MRSHIRYSANNPDNQLKNLHIVIFCDTEGVSRIPSNGFKYLRTGSTPWKHFGKRQLWFDVRAVIGGLRSQGANHFVLWDIHDENTNLPKRRSGFNIDVVTQGDTQLWLSRWARHPFSAALLIGTHARAGVRSAFFSHTIDYSVRQVSVNGEEIGEIGLLAGFAGFFGTPVIMISGDLAAAMEAKRILPRLHACIVKQRIDGADSLCPRKEADKLLRSTCETAIKELREAQTLRFREPTRFSVTFRDSRIQKIVSSAVSGLHRRGRRTIQWESPNFLIGYKKLYDVMNSY